MGWKLQHLDQLGSLSRGRSRHRPRDAAHLYDGPYPFIQTGDVKHAGLYITDYRQTYSVAGLDQSKLWPTGTLCITIAANIADTAILGFDACFPDSVIGFIADESKADTRFVKYLFDATIQQQVQQFTQGAAQDNLSQEKLLSIEFLLPDVNEQRRIADILSAYDNLIENNCRRMALLEDSARQLYREWFVRLRFPGHEHTRITDGVPEGWEKVKVGSLLLKVSRAKKIKKDDYEIEGTIPCVDQGSDFIGGYTNDLDALIEQPLPLIVFGDHTRVLKFVNFPFACGADGTQLIYPNTPKVSSEYLYFALNATELSNYFYARHFKFLKEIEIFIPSDFLVREFTHIAVPCFEQIKVLRTQNEKLRAPSDLLLPRLMSGELAI
jgi:type I restriction enzyme S subunit